MAVVIISSRIILRPYKKKDLLDVIIIDCFSCISLTRLYIALTELYTATLNCQADKHHLQLRRRLRFKVQEQKCSTIFS